MIKIAYVRASHLDCSMVRRMTGAMRAAMLTGIFSGGLFLLSPFEVLAMIVYRPKRKTSWHQHVLEKSVCAFSKVYIVTAAGRFMSRPRDTFVCLQGATTILCIVLCVAASGGNHLNITVIHM